jgi:hypothetical protein
VPAILAVEAAGIAVLWRRPAGKALVVCLVALSLASALSIRTAPRHAKDDYRSAAVVARQALAAGETVWWNADAFGALVYGVPLGGACGEAIEIFEPKHGFAQSIAAPAVVVLSKADIYDPHGTLAAHLRRGGFLRADAFMAFEVWRNPSPTDPCR